MGFRKGGYGLAPHGQVEQGNGRSLIEPRFSFSDPVDHSYAVHLDKVIRFSTYCFSSWISAENLLVEILEEAGGTYQPAFQSGAFIHPYNGGYSKIRYPGNGHEIRVYIQKVIPWARNSKIILRVTGADEYAHVSTKDTPVRWD